MKKKNLPDIFVFGDWQQFIDNKIKGLRIFQFYTHSVPTPVKGQTRALKINLQLVKFPTNVDQLFYGLEMDKIQANKLARSIIGQLWIPVDKDWIVLEKDTVDSLLAISKQSRPALWFNPELDLLLEVFKIRKTN